MAKSKLIKDLIGRKIKLTQALERVLIIAMEINDSDTIKCVKQEKSGYAATDTVPEYRNVSLTPMGTFQLVSMGYIHTYSNQALPTIGVPDSIKEAYRNHSLRQGISQIIDQYESLKDDTSRYGIPIAPEHYFMFEQDTNIQVTNAYLHYSKFDLEKIIDAVRKTFVLTPKGIISHLGLRRPIYKLTTNYGHFGKDNLPWEQLDKVEELKTLLNK